MKTIWPNFNQNCMLGMLNYSIIFSIVFSHVHLLMLSLLARRRAELALTVLYRILCLVTPTLFHYARFTFLKVVDSVPVDS